MSQFARAWQLLTHAHDRVWADRTIPLDERTTTCDILWAAVIRLHRVAGRR